jgi:hypothetical protein
MSDEPTTILDEPITNIAGVNGVDSLTVEATKGSFKVVVEGDESAAISFKATAEEVQKALLLLGAVDVGDITVSGGVGDEKGTKPYKLAYAGQYAGANTPTVTTVTAGLEEGAKKATVAVVTAGTDTNALATQRGTGDADRTEDVSPLTGESPAEDRAANKATYGDA